MSPPPGLQRHPWPGNADAATTLGASATASGRYFGTAVAASKLSDTSTWTVVIDLTSPQKVSTTWSGTFAWSNSGYTMTVKPNGSNTFGFTTLDNGNTSARPASRPAPQADQVILTRNWSAPVRAPAGAVPGETHTQ